jgi:predicted protein tyrosine phosphatase
LNLTRREALLGATTVGAMPAIVPTVPFGSGSISRLIVGGNPVSGTSHLNDALSREMIDYFTSANIKRLLEGCERNGINTWQSRGDRHIVRLLHEYRQEGGRIQWIGQTATEIDFAHNLANMAREKPIGIYYHGVPTDRAWVASEIDTVRDRLKAIRQTGSLVGLGTHIPEVVDYIESKDWDIDFYMTCLYNLSRSEAEKERVAGRPYPGELFWDPDRIEMLKRVSQSRKQCLIFKVYGATRHCQSEDRMLSALRLVARYAKPNDAVVIGMFPKHSDQVSQNARLVRQVFQAA